MMSMQPNLDSLADDIWDASEGFAEYLADDDASGNGRREEEIYKGAVRRAIAEIAESHGLRTLCDYDSASTYIDLEAQNAEGDWETVAQIRISNHRQRYGGAAWSFEPCDRLGQIIDGLAKTQAICEEHCK